MPWQHMHSLLFQSTLPREERHMTVQLHPHRRRFQSTLPREERPSLYLLGAHLHNFNPRSHERSDSQQSELITMLRISIHAPTRGATFTFVIIFVYFTFQSTLPREERHCLNCRRCVVFTISIHAPTRGATGIAFLRYSTLSISIHAPTRGATEEVLSGFKQLLIFQSTLPREERPFVWYQCPLRA